MKLKKWHLLFFCAVFSAGSLYAQPTNDNCASATTLTVNGGCITGTTYNGTTQGSESTPACAGSTYTETVWYKFTATSTYMWLQLYTTGFSGTGAMWDPSAWTAAVYNTTTCFPNSGNLVSCQNSNSVGNGDGIIVNTISGLTVGQTYLVQIGYTTTNQVKLSPEHCISVGDQFAPQCNTCSNTCGPACGFSSQPTVAQVTSTCTNYDPKPYNQGSVADTQCYTFTAVNDTVDFQMIIQSTCGSGNVSLFSWTLYKTGSCGSLLQSGNLSNLRFTGLTIGTSYTYCYAFSVPSSCYHSSYWPYFIGAAPLPVELLFFTGEKDGGGVSLKWATGSEVNNDYFIVERSPDYVTFTEVGRIKGAGNSTANLTYELTDPNPTQGVNYYRLTQVDYDGAVRVYSPISVNYTRSLRATLSPNPAADLSTLDYFADASGQINISIYDETGRTLFQQQKAVEKGKNSISFNTSFLNSGIYFLQVFDDSSAEHIRFRK